jgi:hypothetical protein
MQRHLLYDEVVVRAELVYQFKENPVVRKTSDLWVRVLAGGGWEGHLWEQGGRLS